MFLCPEAAKPWLLVTGKLHGDLSQPISGHLAPRPVSPTSPDRLTRAPADGKLMVVLTPLTLAPVPANWFSNTFQYLIIHNTGIKTEGGCRDFQDKTYSLS